ncbi:YndM family protein [Evansella sp. AB-rgal1]|uniref:YndM family protein n=1 Tax=Evansella sp. AB-rgal1 TaxID=3242696 RepID=UPI00359E35AB
MRHVKALAMKYGIVLIVTLSVLSLFGVPLSWILFVTFLIILPAYVLGDLYIYPRYGSVIAAAADFGLYTVALWIILFLFVDRTATSIQNAIFASIFITFVESLYHEFIIAKMLNIKKEEYMRNPYVFLTEFSEEHDVSDLKEDKKEPKSDSAQD